MSGEYLRDEITPQLMVTMRVRPRVGESPPAPGTVHGRSPRRVLGPNRGRLACRRRPCRLGQNLVGQLVARPGEVGVGGGPRLCGAHQLLRSGVAPLLGGDTFLVAACVGEEGG